MKERDLIYELGRGNWIDSVAGEAVVLGFSLHRPELEMLGAELAMMVQKIPYDNDNFSKVVAKAISLEVEIKKALEKENQTVYIDMIYQDENLKRKNSYTWEYDFVYSYGQYQILMVLPVYQGNDMLQERKKKKAEIEVGGFFDNFAEELYEKTITETSFASQKYRTTAFISRQTGKSMRIVTDHDHEEGYSRGWHEIYYFDDFVTAASAWARVKAEVI